MSIYKLTYLYCDGPECGGLGSEPHNSDPLVGESGAKQRKTARDLDNWKARGSKDYCAECWAQMKAEADQ